MAFIAGGSIEGAQHHVALFAWLAATTKVSLPGYAAHMAQIGPRVLFYRPARLSVEERKIAQAALRDTGRSALRKELTDLVHEHVAALAARPPVPLFLSDAVENHVDALADLLCHGRSVITPGEASAEVEGPGRATLQLRTLATAIAWICGHARAVRIVVIRPWAYVEAGGTFAVAIDGVELYGLDNKERIDLVMPAGES